MPITTPSTARIERSGCAATESWVTRTVSNSEVPPLLEAAVGADERAHSALTAAMMSTREALRAG